MVDSVAAITLRAEQRIRALAEKLGWKCLFQNFMGVHIKYEFACANGHFFTRKGNQITDKSKCNECRFSQMRKNSFERLKAEVQQRGGALLSTDALGVVKKYKIRCAANHEFESSASHILAGSWCRECSAFLTERLCRVVFEGIFGKKFSPASPAWLISSNNTQLKLDGYCEELSLAFEYQGQQHFKFFERYHKSLEDFEDSKQRDMEKAALCNTNGVQLVIIPSFEGKKKSIAKHIVEQLALYNIVHPPLEKEINLSSAYQPVEKQIIEELNNYIKDYGSIQSYEGSTCITVNCYTCGSRWITSSANLKKGAWCAQCEGNKKKDVQYLHELAKKRGGKCLTDDYVNVMTPTMWKCHINEHPPWSARPNRIQQGHWCPYCRNDLKKAKAANIETCQKIAKIKGGRCLTTSYEGRKTLLLLECENGHQWETRANNLLRGTWCRRCPRKHATKD